MDENQAGKKFLKGFLFIAGIFLFIVGLYGIAGGDIWGAVVMLFGVFEWIGMAGIKTQKPASDTQSTIGFTAGGTSNPMSAANNAAQPHVQTQATNSQSAQPKKMVCRECGKGYPSGKVYCDQCGSLLKEL